MTIPVSWINEIISLITSTELRCKMAKRVKRKFRELRQFMRTFDIMMDIQREYAIGHKYFLSHGGY